MEDLGLTRRTIAATLGATAGDPEAGRLRLLGWRARRGWFGHSGMWALVPARPAGHPRALGAPRGVAIARPPAVFRMARLGLDLAFRHPAEVALLHVADTGRAFSRGAFKAGVIFMGASLAFVMMPSFTALLALVGLSLMGMAGAAKVVSWLAAVPARTTRAVRLQRWSTARLSSPAADGDRHQGYNGTSMSYYFYCLTGTGQSVVRSGTYQTKTRGEIMTGVGAAALIAGAIVLFTGPSKSPSVALAASPNAVWLIGRF